MSIIEAKYKTDFLLTIISRIKKAGYAYRNFDPNEQPRLSAYNAIRQVAQSYGVLVHLLSVTFEDQIIHNLRAAFIAGLAEGMGKVISIIQNGDDPVPLDYRDFVQVCYHPSDIHEAISDFASRVAETFQTPGEIIKKHSETFLERLNLGSSSAENEIRDLNSYYLEIDAFRRVARGEARIVVGRKGSGKTAIFLQTRDLQRRNKENVVLDLKPEGYKLIKFKETVLRLLEDGTFQHTIMAFWEYVLLLEICCKILENDKQRHMRDHNLYEPYRRLASIYQTDQFVAEGDFSERMSKLMDTIAMDYNANYGDSQNVRLSSPEVTQLIYKHDIAKLSREIELYLKQKESLWLLFDNIDKGWPTKGIQPEDLIIIRSLLDATRKIERQMSQHGIEAHTVVFLRNDVYELLVEETSDRGKEAKVVLDWTDPDLLREMIRRRIVSNDLPSDARLETIWPKICITHIDGEESSQYLIERCLMSLDI